MIENVTIEDNTVVIKFDSGDRIYFKLETAQDLLRYLKELL